MKLASPLVVAAALALQAPLALAQKFPDHPIKMIVPFAAGGGVDSAARTLATQLQTQLKVPVVVENRAGANGTIGGQAVKSAAGDGYTLLFSAATHVLAKQVMSSAPYDPVTDFAPVARVGEAPLMMVVAPQLPAQNLTDLMAAGRKDPGKLTAGIAAAGAPGHLGDRRVVREASPCRSPPCAPAGRGPAWPGGSPAASPRCWQVGLAAVAPPGVALVGGVGLQVPVDVDQARARSSSLVIQALSSGRKPLFLRLLRQFFRSCSLCAMLTSPHRMKSRSAFRRSRCGSKTSRKRNLACCRSSPEEPLGK
jgi:hypothetical protein